MPTLDELRTLPGVTAAVGRGDDATPAPPTIIVGTTSDGDVLIDSVSHDSRAVAPGSLFACLRGDAHDGHDFAERAARAGARALLVDHELATETTHGLPQLLVADTRLALGPISAAVAGEPSRALAMVGITGTNGKTSTAAMTAAILEANGWRTGVLGTLSGTRTTPEAPELQRRLAAFLEEGCRAAVLEVSSHALALHRVDGTRFDVAVFTNLGRDHLDLHGSPEDYFRAKAALFEPTFTSLAVINVDDPHGRLLADAIGNVDRSAIPGGEVVRVVEFGSGDLADVDVSPTAHSYRWRGHRVEVPIGGHFNVANSHAALVTATELGVPPGVAVEGLATLAPIPGRFEHVQIDREEYTGPRGISVVVDYAHTPDGLRELIAAGRGTIAAGARVIVVFGCGGERDQEKRSEMGAIASSDADRVFVTSDNPRREDPERIVEEILAGVPDRYRSRVTALVDRRSAIAEAIAAAAVGDLVLIAGKGHETYQDLGDRMVELDDRAVARSVLEGHS